MRSFEIPYLPQSAPELATPSDFVLPLYPHQRRALHRMAAIERDPSFLRDQFTAEKTGLLLNYKVKGGCLSDLVGMGKTATVLALICSEPRSAELGPNLLVAPTHLLDQWSREAAKFCPAGVRVVTGLKAFQDQVRAAPGSFDNRTLVVADAHSVLHQRRVWYHWRKVYPYPADAEMPPHKHSLPQHVSSELGELYRRKAIFISGGYTGALFGVGGPKEQALWFPQLVLGGGRVFRRVLFDEVQDLIEEGRAEKDCILQLTQHALNVWLVTATPFPAQALSVKANHELLGFKRLTLVCESEAPLPAEHPFEVIKRRLYVRSHAEVRNEAITATHAVRIVPVKLSALERVLYAYLLAANEDLYPEDGAHVGRPERFWADCFMGARASLTHLGATERLRDELQFFDAAKKRIVVPSARELATGGVVRFATELLKVRERHVEITGRQVTELRDVQVPALRDTVRLCERLLVDVVNQQGLTRGWISRSPEQARKWLVQYNVRRMRTTSYEASKGRDKLVAKHEWLEHEEDDAMAAYMANTMLDMSFFPHFKANAHSSLASAEARLKTAAAALPRMTADVAKLRLALSEGHAELQRLKGDSAKWGAKIEALLALLRGIAAAAAAAGEREQALVFTAHPDAVGLLQAALDKSGLAALSLVGNVDMKAAAIRDFSDGKAGVLLACSTLAASGTNLQCARHVVFVDIPGGSATQATALLVQSMGRVIRMGQTRSVTVHYLVADDTIEVGLTHAVVNAIVGVAASDVHKDYTAEGELKLHEPLRPAGDKLAFDGLELVVQKSLEERLTDALNRARDEGKVLDLADADNTPTQPEDADQADQPKDTDQPDQPEDADQASAAPASGPGSRLLSSATSSSSSATTPSAPSASQGCGGSACSPFEVDDSSALSLRRPHSECISLVSSDDEASRSSARLPSAHALIGAKRVKLEGGEGEALRALTRPLD
jgi:hypothetical protein